LINPSIHPSIYPPTHPPIHPSIHPSIYSCSGWLQDVEVSGDKDDSRLLHVVVYKPSSSVHATRSMPILSARFVFDDHIRCMAAKQRLIKGRQRARQQKMATIERLLDIQIPEGDPPRGAIPGKAVQQTKLYTDTP
jgi:hypothetical protein